MAEHGSAETRVVGSALERSNEGKRHQVRDFRKVRGVTLILAPVTMLPGLNVGSIWVTQIKATGGRRSRFEGRDRWK